MSTSVLIPWRTTDPQRTAVWERLKVLWAEDHPTWEIVEGTAKDGPWVKADAWRDALEKSSGDYVVFCDADCYLPHIGEAVEACRFGARWAQGQDVVVRLSQVATRAVVEEGWDPFEAVRLGFQDDEPARKSSAGVGTVLFRDDAFAIPLDPRFVGWGWEDLAWSVALRTMLGIDAWRHEGSWCIHLWHEPQPDKDRTKGGGRANWMHYRRYKRVEGDLAGMQGLLGEITTGKPD